MLLCQDQHYSLLHTHLVADTVAVAVYTVADTVAAGTVVADTVAAGTVAADTVAVGTAVADTVVVGTVADFAHRLL